MKKMMLSGLFMMLCCLIGQAQNAPVRFIVIGAHPDDCDIDAGATAALLASMGHAVKFLSVTNGDAGHQSMGGGVLAKVRKEEAREAGRRLGIDEYEVLGNHDGELTPNLNVRLQIIRKIREWNADVVIAPRPNDYHPDHRYTGVLVQDAAYMVAVPNIAPETPALKKNPVFLYTHDGFQSPEPFRPDIAIAVDDTYHKKIDALDAHVSQVYEWLPWIGGYLDKVPTDPQERKKWLSGQRSSRISPETRKSLEKWYGAEKAAAVTHAEAFQICEYGRQPNEEEIRRLFPMLSRK
jgi:LmbE family N-acetylglucosaminyl deacetylase